MNPLVHRGTVPHDDDRPPPADAPVQVAPLTGELSATAGAQEAAAPQGGELFLPGWLKIELPPEAEQGPGA